MDASLEKLYTVDDILALPEGERAELIDGMMFDMAAPSTMHQDILMNLSSTFYNHIKSKGGECKVFPAPFGVFLFKDNRNYVEPDVTVVCDKNKLSDRGCEGAPDLVVEIISESSRRMDNLVKLNKYKAAGVREYLIIDPFLKTVKVINFETEDYGEYSFADKITIALFNELSIDLSEFM